MITINFNKVFYIISFLDQVFKILCVSDLYHSSILSHISSVQQPHRASGYCLEKKFFSKVRTVSSTHGALCTLNPIMCESCGSSLQDHTRCPVSPCAVLSLNNFRSISATYLLKTSLDSLFKFILHL